MWKESVLQNTVCKSPGNLSFQTKNSCWNLSFDECKRKADYHPSYIFNSVTLTHTQ